MNLAVPGVVAHLFHIQRVLTQGGVDRVWISPAFHCELADWKVLTLQAASRPTHLAEIIRQEPTHLGFCDASGIGAGGVWLDPSGRSHNLFWWHPWPAGVTSELVLLTNPHGTITNSYLDLVALVIQEFTLLKAFPKARMAALRSGSGKTPTISWSKRKALMIKPVVADLLRICALHFRILFLNPSVFLSPGPRKLYGR